jgi:alkylhydroperoxidase/carboxymuconolactone decarboxylase family protein YurZ
MPTNPWRSGILPRRLVELIGVAMNAACTNLDPEGTRRHIRGALHAGATREEILFVLKCASVMAIHSCSLGAPILLEEPKAAGLQPPPVPGTRRHIRNASQAGATMVEIMEVPKLCVVQGMQSCNMGVPILAEELARQPVINQDGFR